RLILRYIVRSFARLLHNLSRAHSLDDLGVAVGEKLAHLELVLMEIVRQPDQRPAEAILVGRVEVDMIIAIAIVGGMDTGSGIHRAEIVVLYGLLPFGAPSGRSRRRQRVLDGPSARLDVAQIAAAHETMRAVVEIVAIELVDAHADRAGSDEGIEDVLVLVEEPDRGRNRLVRKIASDLAFTRLRVVGLADP